LINQRGMADIWLATDKAGKTYALRRCIDNLRFDLQRENVFCAGARYFPKFIDHECVIGYLHTKNRGALYLLMEYVEGSNLKVDV